MGGLVPGLVILIIHRGLGPVRRVGVVVGLMQLGAVIRRIDNLPAQELATTFNGGGRLGGQVVGSLVGIWLNLRY